MFTGDFLVKNLMQVIFHCATLNLEPFNSRKNFTMTDWDQITGDIQNAMHAVDKAHEVTKELRDDASLEAFDRFRSEMQNLTEHLTDLQAVLNNQEAFALDEIADWLSKAFGGKQSDFRRTPRMKV